MDADTGKKKGRDKMSSTTQSEHELVDNMLEKDLLNQIPVELSNEDLVKMHSLSYFVFSRDYVSMDQPKEILLAKGLEIPSEWRKFQDRFYQQMGAGNSADAKSSASTNARRVATHSILDNRISAIPDNQENEQNEQRVRQKETIYQVHSDGHLIVISEYSKQNNAIVTYRASSELLHSIICKKKKTVIVDLEKLSNIQVGEIQKLLDRLKDQISVKKVRKNGREVWVIKYKRVRKL